MSFQNRVLARAAAGSPWLSRAAFIVGSGRWSDLALPQYSISQKGREFHPGEISDQARRDDQIVNDDGDLLHHAYIDSPKFSFDSGDQKPGSKTDDHLPGGRRLRRAVRHPSEDAARGPRHSNVPPSRRRSSQGSRCRTARRGRRNRPPGTAPATPRSRPAGARSCAAAPARRHRRQMMPNKRDHDQRVADQIDLAEFEQPR